MDNRPIGVFDSGLGGLTVLKEMKHLLPNENFVYFGDCGRIPYGTKSKDTVRKYTIQDIKFLLSQDVKAIVIACNTASAYGHEFAQQKFDLPIFEVVTPGARAAVRETKNNRIGVIATQGTVSTNVYEQAMLDVSKRDLNIFSKACPLFVPLAEEGWWNNEISNAVANEYLSIIKENNVDVLVLGCTHYPLLWSTISSVMGADVKLVSSGIEVANDVINYLKANNLENKHSGVQQIKYFTSDDIETFGRLGESFLGEPIGNVEKIEIDKY